MINITEFRTKGQEKFFKNLQKKGNFSKTRENKQIMAFKQP
jgi:hypothetical protein